jgi:peptidoglycan/xylan/chitin deacetylase (PgdA/CDA1 family)
LKNVLLSTWNIISPIRNYFRNNWFTVILYHKIEPELFRKHVNYYESNFRICHLNLLKKHFKYNTPLPRNTLIITFDDGWRSNYDLLPIIEEKRVPITIFITTGLIGTNKKPHPIHYYYDNKIDEAEYNYPTESERTMLNVEEIKDMSNLVNFQSHGVHHYLSTHITSNQLKSELLESKKIIEKITGNSVYAFAYPYNRAGENEAKIVESCGYTFARIGGRLMNKPESNRYLINSIGIEENCTIERLHKKILRAEIKTVLQ